MFALSAAAARASAAENAVPPISVGPSVFHAATPQGVVQPSELVFAAPRLPASARHALGPLGPAERAVLRSRDERGDLRRKAPALKIGLTRPLPEDVGFAGLPSDLRPGQSRVLDGGLLERGADGKSIWTASFSSAGAGALRLHVREARLPAGSRVFVYGPGGRAHGPYGFEWGTRPEGFWTNTVFADEIFLEVQLGLASEEGLRNARLVVASLVHLEHPVFAPSAGAKASAGLRPKSQTCFVDASCVTPSDFPRRDEASRAVGQLNFVDAGFAYLCSGGLVSTTTGNGVPYLLTANHCFNNQPAATSLEAFWNYKTASCNGPFPDESLFPRTLGSTLLATAETSDFTLVQLSQPPPDNSVFLGWTTEDVAHAGGTLAYRLSYPDGHPQFFAKHEVSATPTPVSCSDAPQGNFVYSKDVQGGTGGGSSGAPAYLGDLRVIGQELGSCGTNLDDDCDVVSNSTLDGAFRVTYPAVQQWLAPSAPGPCTPGLTTLCLNGGRFRVTVSYATAAGANGPGMAVPLTGDSGYFWFFAAANIELVVKVLDACAVNGRFWVFAGGLTNVHVVLLVVDTQTGATRTYTNSLGTAFAPLQDTSALACP